MTFSMIGKMIAHDPPSPIKVLRALHTQDDPSAGTCSAPTGIFRFSAIEYNSPSESIQVFFTLLNNHIFFVLALYLARFHWLFFVETRRAEFAKKDPKALSRLHLAKDLFLGRPARDGREGTSMIGIREELGSQGAGLLV